MSLVLRVSTYYYRHILAKKGPLFVRRLSVFAVSGVALGVRDSRQNKKKRKKGRAKKNKNGGNEWTGPPIYTTSANKAFFPLRRGKLYVTVMKSYIS